MLEFCRSLDRAGVLLGPSVSSTPIGGGGQLTSAEKLRRRLTAHEWAHRQWWVVAAAGGLDSAAGRELAAQAQRWHPWLGGRAPGAFAAAPLCALAAVEQGPPILAAAAAPYAHELDVVWSRLADWEGAVAGAGIVAGVIVDDVQVVQAFPVEPDAGGS